MSIQLGQRYSLKDKFRELTNEELKKEAERLNKEYKKVESKKKKK